MNKQDTIIILGTAHRMRLWGKESPDKRLKECKYSRERCLEVASELRAMGYKAEIDYMPLDLPKTMQSPSQKQETNNELAMRVNYVNEICRQRGIKNVLYVSMHINASNVDGKWHDANGWQVCVGTKTSESSKRLAGCLFDAAKHSGLRMRQPAINQKYWPQNLYILNNTKCPAVLTENLFQDNKKDVDYLLSDVGKDTIVKLHVEGIINYIEE
jgi:N-acetylmuramoyl-L-alanine amidase